MAARKKTRTIAGSEFLTDLTSKAVSQPLRCWVGLLPECPINQADVGGMSFVKHTENLVRDPSDPRSTRRVPVVGTIGFLDPEKVDDFVDRMKRQVVRTTSTRDDGSKVGRPIRIPTAAAVAAGSKPYTPQKGDEPLARYAYFQVLEDQQEGQPGTSYPEPIEITGIEVPESATDPQPTA